MVAQRTLRLDPNDPSSFPKRSELPEIPGAMPGAAWVWGADDEHGRLNLLTEKRIKAASALIKQGKVIPLNLPLELPSPALFCREDTVHQLKHLAPGAWDETVFCNPQSGSQWDGFRHVSPMMINPVDLIYLATADHLLTKFADPKTLLFYNGLTEDDIKKGKECTKQGAQAWAATGIAGRGVLLDVWEWAQASGKTYDPFTFHSITVADLKATAQAQGTTLEVGDILIIRTGWVDTYHKSSDAKKQELAAIRHTLEHYYVGLEQSEEMLDYLHDGYFAAAASDCICFEAWPPSKTGPMLHAYMLPRWGMPMGELWDLEKLAEKCKAEGRYTFFLTSAPDNVSGSVGSRPNALAIF